MNNMRILIVDLNHSLIEKALARGYRAILDDYFLTAYRESKAVLMTASNPMWTFGGGIDAAFKVHFPKLVQFKQTLGGEMERIANVVCTITVDKNIKATKETVKKAISFAIECTGDDETLCVHGAGTGIGGLSEEDFLDAMDELTYNLK